MIREYQESDYEMLCEWWAARSWPLIPRDALSTTGLVCNECCAGFLFLCNSKICWMEWLVSDPSSPSSKESVTELIDALLNMAQATGYKYVMHTTDNQKLIARLLGHGFKETDKGTTVLIKEV